MMKAHLAVGFFFLFFKKRKRLGGSSGSVGGGGVSLKESPVVVLTPDASSRCESFFPRRVISALLLLMLLLLRRFSMIRKERKRDRERNWETGSEREWKKVCATSHWHKYLFTTRHKLAPCQSASLFLFRLTPLLYFLLCLSLPPSPHLSLCAAKRIITLPGSALSHYHILITFVKGSIWEFNE